MDFTDTGALETLNWMLGVVPSTPVPTALYIKLHVGDPGADGSANPAIEARRTQVTFSGPSNVSTDGRAQAATDADVIWLIVAAAETYTHISIWDAATAGTAWYKGPMVAPVTVAAGSNFTFPLGSTIDHA